MLTAPQSALRTSDKANNCGVEVRVHHSSDLSRHLGCTLGRHIQQAALERQAAEPKANTVEVKQSHTQSTLPSKNFFVSNPEEFDCNLHRYQPHALDRSY